MGVRNDYTIHIDPKTDVITTAWVGPDQSVDSTTWGEAKTENATMMNSAGNYGWPFCQAGNRWGYRAKLRQPHRRRPAGQPVRQHPGHGRRRRRRPDRRVLGLPRSRSPTLAVQHGPAHAPAASPVNIWYGPQGGCYTYPKNANGVGIYTNNNYTPSPGITRRARSRLSTGSQAPMDGGIYRRPATPGRTRGPPTGTAAGS